MNAECGREFLLWVAQSMRITLEANSKGLLVRELLDRGEREKTNRMVMINTNEHDDLFPEVRFQWTYSPSRRPQRPGLFQPFPSLKRSPGPSELLFSKSNQEQNFPARTTTQLVSLASITKEFWSQEQVRKKRSNPSARAQKNTTNLSR